MPSMGQSCPLNPDKSWGRNYKNAIVFLLFPSLACFRVYIIQLGIRQGFADTDFLLWINASVIKSAADGSGGLRKI